MTELVKIETEDNPALPERKKSAAERALDLHAERMRTLVRTVGPVLNVLPERFAKFRRDPQQMRIGRCILCEPEVTYLKCVVCDWEVPTDQKWRMRVHTWLNPETCRRIGEKKVRKWASQV